MRCCIVKASVLAREKTWLPSHYLGNIEDEKRVIQSAKKIEKEARTRRKNAVKKARARLKKTDELLRRGDIKRCK